MYKRRYHKNRLIFAGAFMFAFAAVFAFLSTSNQDKTEAASTANFRAGNIMSDAVMSDYNSMTIDQIQAFLKSRNSCNMSADPSSVGAIRYDTGSWTKLGITYNRRYYFNTSKGVASAYYHVKDGHFVCLADETINGHSAAYHIWDSAQTFKINPKVLIVLLEKEQSLITDKFPNHAQYQGATGYGYPDNGDPDPRFFGLESQLANAANLFHTVLTGGWTNFPLGTNYIQYNPNPGCGGSKVKIENLATSALYRYTPYQPNSAALAAGYGVTGDGCGAYGNRNFFLLYSDWFGDPQKPSGLTVSIRTTANHPVKVEKSTVSIDEGIYTISSSTNKNFVVDVYGASTTEGSNIQIWKNNNTIAQKFHIRRAGEGYYYIENLKSGLMLAVNYDNNIIQADYSKQSHIGYLWSASGSKDSIVFTSVATGLVLDVYGNRMVDGNNINGWDSNGTAAQKFKLNLVAKTAVLDTDQNKDGKADSFILTSKITNDNKHVVDIAAAKKANGTNTWLWTINNTNAQKFKIEAIGNGFYRIIASTGTAKDGSPMVLDVYSASTDSGANVNLWQWNHTVAQQWLPVLNDDGTYSILSRCNGLALDVFARQIKDGTNIQIWDRNNTIAQKFNLIRV